MRLIQSINAFCSDNANTSIAIALAIMFSIYMIIKTARHRSIEMATLVVIIVLSVAYVAVVVIGLLYAPALQLTDSGAAVVMTLSAAYCGLLFWIDD